MKFATLALLGAVAAEDIQEWYPCKDITVEGFNDVTCTAPNRKIAAQLMNGDFSEDHIKDTNGCLWDDKGSVLTKCSSTHMVITRFPESKTCDPDTKMVEQIYKFGKCTLFKTNIKNTSIKISGKFDDTAAPVSDPNQVKDDPNQIKDPSKNEKSGMYLSSAIAASVLGLVAAQF